jgi:hypothetical protein
MTRKHASVPERDTAVNSVGARLVLYVALAGAAAGTVGLALKRRNRTAADATADPTRGSSGRPAGRFARGTTNESPSAVGTAHVNSGFLGDRTLASVKAIPEDAPGHEGAA